MFATQGAEGRLRRLFPPSATKGSRPNAHKERASRDKAITATTGRERVSMPQSLMPGASNQNDATTGGEERRR